MPEVSGEDVEETNRRENGTGQLDLFLDVFQNDVGVMKKTLVDDLGHVAAVKFFIDAHQTHIVPFWTRVEHGHGVQRSPLIEQGGRQTQENADGEDRRQRDDVT